ncbi:CapA family protein [Clostridium swellfunianum]|uniref:CapA family protein n=1 Tax=Clostridium swellfunianum TaxID=1367462 RepID=UPI00202E97AD|nr:CapA family protein [Clostridium swellfunianum]MCM0646983.1 CapA family protein [Clostridium swellfunianum]
MRKKRSSKHKNKRKKVIIAILIILSLCGALFYAYKSLAENKKNQNVISSEVKPIVQQEEPQQEKIKPIEERKTPVKKEVIVSSTGDSTLGWDEKFSFNGSLGHVFDKNNKDYSYFYKNVAPIFEADDITTTNLETTFTNSNIKASKEFTFKAPPEFVQALTNGSIEGVTIANNHTRDYLEQGLIDTKNTLKKADVKYFGEGEKWIENVKGQNFGFLGYKGYSYDKAFLKKLDADIEELKNQNAIILINFHWGDEGTYYPNNVQKFLAHYSIDKGADIIIGHHPHVIQGLESYKGKVIAYSLGNFCFGGNKNPSDKDSFILQTKFNFEDEQLKSYEIKVIPCSISSVTNLNNYQPTPLEGAKKEEFFKKINKLSQNLNFELKDDFFLIDVNN